jgi:trimeric autotransporter adhesin
VAKLIGGIIYSNRKYTPKPLSIYPTKNQRFCYLGYRSVLLFLRLLTSKSFKTMKLSIRALLLFFFILVSCIAFAQSNNLNSATDISPVTTCGATGSQTLYNATADGPTSTCGTANDVWYTFTTPIGVTSVQINVSVGGGSNLDNTNAFIEAFNTNSPGGVIVSNSLGCTNIGGTLTLTGLTASTLYYFRVFTSATPTTTPTNKWSFSVCVSYTAPVLPPSNDECLGATALTDGNATAGTVWGATASSSIAVGCATGNPDDDVWYKFTTASFDTSLVIALSSVGSNLTTSGTRIQLFNGSCGSLTSLACGTTSLTASVTGSTTYYIKFIRRAPVPSVAYRPVQYLVLHLLHQA